jgi:hypothetical protein
MTVLKLTNILSSVNRKKAIHHSSEMARESDILELNKEKDSMESIVQQTRKRRRSLDNDSEYFNSHLKIFSYYEENGKQFVDITNSAFLAQKYSPNRLKEIRLMQTSNRLQEGNPRQSRPSN